MLRRLLPMLNGHSPKPADEALPEFPEPEEAPPLAMSDRTSGEVVREIAYDLIGGRYTRTERLGGDRYTIEANGIILEQKEIPGASSRATHSRRSIAASTR